MISWQRNRILGCSFFSLMSSFSKNWHQDHVGMTKNNENRQFQKKVIFSKHIWTITVNPINSITIIIRAVTSIKNDHPSTLSPNDRVFEYFKYCSANFTLTQEHAYNCSNDKFQAQISLQILTGSSNRTGSRKPRTATMLNGLKSPVTESRISSDICWLFATVHFFWE